MTAATTKIQAQATQKLGKAVSKVGAWDTPAPLALATIPLLPPPPLILQVGSGHVLTVGAGMEFRTLSDALSASADGDTIAVRAGTYTNDFCTVNTKVHILALGGVVNEVATSPPPNDKGIILVNADLTIQGFTFTGGSDGSPDGNVAGIRYQGGNMTVSYCYFHNMQEGLLAASAVNGTGNITIDHSEFASNGTGDGYTHNLYVGNLASLTVTNSYFHDADVGHEIKSRAAITTIRNNVIADGPTGTASYDIDLPNGGVAVIANNVIEKGALASNWFAIHYGGETQIAWANNSLSVTGNTILNDLPVNGTAVFNQSAVNGLHVLAKIDGDSFGGFDQAHLLIGAGAVTNAKILSHGIAGSWSYSTATPWTNVPPVQLSGGKQVLNLASSGHVVTGGTAMLIVTDRVGSNTITGGAGGLHANIAASWDTLSTFAETISTVVLDGRNDTIHSAGADLITMNSTYGEVDASGAATIFGASYSTYTLAGAETITLSGGGRLNVLTGGKVGATLLAGIDGSKAGGASLRITGQGLPGGASATIAGGAATFSSDHGTSLRLAYGDGGATATLGGGTFIVTGGGGADNFTTGSGTAVITLGGGAASVSFSTGAVSVSGGSGLDTYVFDAKQAGAASITGFKAGRDVLSFRGFTGPQIANGVVSGGSTTLTLADGATIKLIGVVLPNYGSGTNNGGPGAGGSPGAGTISPPPASGLLTTRGNSVAGGAARLVISDIAGGNTISGGAGGILAGSLTTDVVTTAAGSNNRLNLAGHCSLSGAGADQVTVAGTYNVVHEAAASMVAIAVWGNEVDGGAGLLTVSDAFGGNTLVGGSGGLIASVGGNYETISTFAGANDSISAAGYSQLMLAGTDNVRLGGLYNSVTALGDVTIAADGGWSSFDFEGHDTMQGVGAGVITVGRHASATLVSTGAGGSSITKLAGGVVLLHQSIPGSTGAAVTVSGGQAVLGSSGGVRGGVSVTTAASNTSGVAITAGTGSVTVTSLGVDTVLAGASTISVRAQGGITFHGGSGSASVTGGAGGMDVTGGSGATTLTGGSGNDTFTGGSGSSVLWLGSGSDHVTFGSGNSDVHAGASVAFTVVAGTAAHATIFGWNSADTLVFNGFTGQPIVSQAVTGGSTFLSLSDGTQIELANFSHFS